MTRFSQPDPLTAPAAPEDRWVEWDNFVSAHPHGGFMQSAAWIRCRAEDGYDHFVLMFRDEDHRLAGGAVVGRWKYGDNHAFYYIQEGPLLPDEPELSEAVMNAVLSRLEQHRRDDSAVVSHLRIEPRLTSWPSFAAAGFEPPWRDDRFREPRHTHCVDLRATELERLQAMKPKGRYNVGLARRAGVTVVQDNTDRGLNDFLAIRGDTARRQGLTRRTRGHFAMMLNEFGPGAKVFFAELDDRRLACAFVLRFGDRATYFYGGSLDEKREAMAPYLLHHEIMIHMASAGCSSYDFWGTSPPGQPTHAWAGISAFKRKFGGAEIALAPTQDHIYDRAAYARFVDNESEPVRTAASTTKHFPPSADTLT